MTMFKFVFCHDDDDDDDDDPVWPHCTHFAWFSALLKPLAQLSNVLYCPVNATTADATVPTREGSKEKSKLLEQSSSSCFECDLRQWRRGACRSDYNTTSARLSVARKNQRRSGSQINLTAPLNFFQETKTSFRSSDFSQNTQTLLKHVAHSKRTQCVHTTTKTDGRNTGPLRNQTSHVSFRHHAFL